ncbi:hypothetical protein QBC43DRAFT_361925 [Cladorrhinum sp. PSN259]|nr:hypothetical protein QBC43DRAFT_361925 [Cladorrhinum sp. PSN259]
MINTLFFIVIWALSLVMISAYEGTTTFDSILVAHPSPTFCPPAKDFALPARAWHPDENYIACCNDWAATYTLTSGRGPGGTSVYACCRSGYTCTAPVSLMMDWSIDGNDDLQTTNLANPPLPAYVPATTTAPPHSSNTGTVSRPGATPIATSSGVVVYVYNDNSNTNTNNNNNNNDNTNDGTSSEPASDGGSGGGLSGGTIAGITVAATVVSAIAAVFGVKYARRQARISAGSGGNSKTESTGGGWSQNQSQPESPQGKRGQDEYHYGQREQSWYGRSQPSG